MNLFNVYNITNINLIKGKGVYVYDQYGEKYLDFYGGHAVISIGHSHPYYINSIKNQINDISFYSNTVYNDKQIKIAELLGKISSYNNYNLFICNSGAEAVENALKLASFRTKKRKVISFKNSFHGRTSGAVSITYNNKIISEFNKQHEVIFMDIGDLNLLENKLKKDDISCVIIEGIQGIAGIIDPGIKFLSCIKFLCEKYKSIFIIDEVQSGYGRTGNFFAHQYNNDHIKPDLITVAKGMGNGFPIGGVLIHPKFKAFNGMLGTTYGGNYLACTAGISVLEIIKNENLIFNAKKIGKILINKLSKVRDIEEIRGRGLMLGLKFKYKIDILKNILLKKYKIFVGTSSDPKIIRLLPPLNINENHIEFFVKNLKMSLEDLKNEK